MSATLAATITAGSASAAPHDNGTENRNPEAQVRSRADNLPNPLARKQDRLRKEAMRLLAHGKAEARPARGGGSTVQVGRKQHVEFFDNNKQANVWTVLSEFGDEVTESGGEAGPRHNEMPEPDRAEDNTTQWTDDFDVAHFDEMFNGDGESFKNFYLDQSSGEYTPTVTTEDWVQVPRNGNYYGDNTHEAEGYWAFVNDTVDAWYAEQKAAGKTDAEIASYLGEQDKWDRYDFNGNGNFNEPDGYIDHFQAIHAGAGEEAGGGVLGDDAIWSHRWYADYTTIGSEGPTVGGAQNLMGGQEIGDTAVFVGDYTIEPETGGLGVFAHEYAHDLGLPDFYDTRGGENSTAFWTLMSSGSWMGLGDDDDPASFTYGIGGVPNDMGAEEKLYLGWLDTTVVKAGTKKQVRLGAAGDPGSNDAIQVLLPDAETTKVVGEPFAGEASWYSDSGDGLNNTLSRTIAPAGTVKIDAQAWYDTEAGYDYWYAQYSLDGGNTWETLARYDGASEWAPVSYTYEAGGQESIFRFYYQTDGGWIEPGVMLDEITTTVDGTVLDTDGAETDTSAWETGGWMRTSGTITETAPQYYLIENKAYTGYDRTLEVGPYNFSEGWERPDWVEHFPYQDGMLVWYVNHSQLDNNTSVHPGTGYALPVDANPEAMRWSSGSLARNRISSFDSTFGVGSTDPVTLHRQVSDGNGGFVTQETSADARPMVPTFDDSDPMRYYDAANPTGSVKVAGVGVKATVTRNVGDSLLVFVDNPRG
jgi:immune inhibitor A